MGTGVRRQSINAPDVRFEDERLNRVVQAVRAIAIELQAITQLLRGGTAGQVLEKTAGSDYDGTWSDVASQGVTGGQNLGAGTGLVFKDVSGTTMQFRSLVPGANITLVVDANTITIAAASGSSGSGTVTAVGISSTDLTVTGSPVTTAGDIELEIAPNAVTYAKMQQTTQDSIVLGRRFGDGIGDVEELTAADILTIIGAVTSSGYPKQLGYAGL